MKTRNARFVLVSVTLLAGFYAACRPVTATAQSLGPEGATVRPARNVPALEPSFSLDDVPELPARRAPAPWTSATPAAVALAAAETDADHVARLMAARLRCGEPSANDVGGRSADCRVIPSPR